jgi:hypothetical protein
MTDANAIIDVCRKVHVEPVKLQKSDSAAVRKKILMLHGFPYEYARKVEDLLLVSKTFNEDAFLQWLDKLIEVDILESKLYNFNH